MRYSQLNPNPLVVVIGERESLSSVINQWRPKALEGIICVDRWCSRHGVVADELIKLWG